MIGQLHPEIVTALTRKPSPENKVELCLYGLSVTIGPVRVGSLGSDEVAFVGWMGLVLSGPGYFYPWTFREARERAEACPIVRELVEACNREWPVPPAKASPAAIQGRRDLSELWLYDDVTLPPGWWWFAKETG